jgi:hypothetical protein
MDRENRGSGFVSRRLGGNSSEACDLIEDTVNDLGIVIRQFPQEDFFSPLPCSFFVSFS